MLKSQDVLVAAALAVHPSRRWSFQGVAEATGLSQSAAFRAVQRLRDSKLVVPDEWRVFDERFAKFLEHGVPYVFAANPGKIARGLPTAYAAPPLSEHISASTAVVWPYVNGSTRGESVKPLAPTAPEAALRDESLYHVLALIDALRIGRAREQKLAGRLLRETLGRCAGHH